MTDRQHDADLDLDLDRRFQQIYDARLRQETRRGNALLQLLSARPELREVCPLADFVGERLLWCA